MLAITLLIAITGCGQFQPKWPPPAEGKQTIEIQVKCLCQCSECACGVRAAATSQPGPPAARSPQPVARSPKITGYQMPGGPGVCPGCDAAKADLKSAGIDIDWKTADGPTPSGWLPDFVWIGSNGKQHHWSPPTHQWLAQTSVNELLSAVKATR